MVLREMNRSEEAELVENAVAACVREQRTTADLGGRCGTAEVGREIRRRIRKAA